MSSNSDKSTLSSSTLNAGGITPLTGLGLAAENFNSINSGEDSANKQKEQTSFT